MNKILFLVMLFYTGQVFSQAPSITAAEMQVVGDSLVSQLCSANNFNAGASGANVTWDFSHLTSLNTSVQYWVAPSANQNGDSFPAANQSIITHSAIPGVYNVADYLQLTSSSLSIRGYEVPAITYYYDAEDFLRFPCTYTNAFVDSFHATIHDQGAPPYYRLGTISVQADGYGTLKLPNGTFNNVLRVKFVENYRDDLTSLGAGNVYYTSLLYNWYKPGVKGAILSYDSAWHTNGTPDKILGYQSRLSGTTGIEEGTIASAIKIYPNPADRFLTIDAPETRYEYSINDLSGHVISSATATENSTRIDLSGFAGGLYFVNLKMESGTTLTRKIVIN